MSRGKVHKSSKDQHPLTLWTVALHDYNTAVYLAENPKISPNSVGMHLQQSAEKAIKAYLLKKHVKYKFIHNLYILFEDLAELEEIPTKFDLLRALTQFASQLRYELPVEEDEWDKSSFIDLTHDFLRWISTVGDFKLD